MILENSMVIGGIAPFMEDSTPVFCDTCGRDLEEVGEAAIECNGGNFCRQACASKALYRDTETATGKAALMRLVAALTLLAEEDVEELAPKIQPVGFDMATVYVPNNEHIRFASIQNLREQAMALLPLFEAEGSVTWAVKAAELAEDFAVQVGKAVA